jgi:hypothetical protein
VTCCASIHSDESANTSSDIGSVTAYTQIKTASVVGNHAKTRVCAIIRLRSYDHAHANMRGPPFSGCRIFYNYKNGRRHLFFESRNPHL